MASIALVSGLHGIYSVTTTGTFNLVYSTPSGHLITALWAVQGTQGKIFALDNSTLIYSLDNGSTWSQYPSRTLGGGDGFFADNSNVIQGIFPDENGWLWTVGNFTVSPTPAAFDIFRSIDDGINWSTALTVLTLSPLTRPGPGFGWISDGAYAGLFYNDASNPNISYIAIIDSTALTWGLYTIPNLFHVGNNPVTTGWYGCDRLFAFVAGGGLLDIMIIPRANPASAFVVTAPFGTEYPAWIIPLPNGTAVAHATNITHSLGSIWRSNNGGMSWTQVVPDTSQLAIGTSPFRPSAIRANYTNPSELWLLGAYPYIYHSNDGGLTWTSFSAGALGDSFWRELTVVRLIQNRRVPVSTVVGAS